MREEHDHGQPQGLKHFKETSRTETVPKKTSHAKLKSNDLDCILFARNQCLYHFNPLFQQILLQLKLKPKSKSQILEADLVPRSHPTFSKSLFISNFSTWAKEPCVVTPESGKVLSAVVVVVVELLVDVSSTSSMGKKHLDRRPTKMLCGR